MLQRKFVFKTLDRSLLSDAVSLAAAEYSTEQKLVAALYDKDYSPEIKTCLDNLIRKGKGFALLENDKLAGFMGVFISENADFEGYKTAYCPTHGYGIKKAADRGKIASLLFQNISEMLLPDKVRHYAINIYAHDKEVIESFVLNQFGIICNDSIKNIDEQFTTEKVKGIIFREFSKANIRDNKYPLLRIWRKLANHLRKSPSYYYGDEFTDDAYLEHLNDINTRLFTATDETQQIIGVVDISPSRNHFITSDASNVNVGNLYIEPEYRGKHVAQGLLQYVSDVLIKDNYKRMWVEHGTVNPNALRFWNKYFTPFTYQLTRSIDSRIVDSYRR